MEFEVQGMTCGHCERAVTKAVQALDPDARVAVDRAAGRVSVDSRTDPQAVRKAIEDEGYRVGR
ncbi:heavy-metal-associated domain-containing protein [Citreimonas salinaria]|uniref:Copper chaperone n=1 Tax=Citreimonas salinaria TaxID=321339 RepID=A0A1H3P4D2_9RHOB|nr:cation transporter [Citreimonas salinaria]SDY95685.1 copper chaperone [Citreimonas salinaria]